MKTFEQWKKDKSEQALDQSKVLLIWLLVSILIAAIAA